MVYIRKAKQLNKVTPAAAEKPGILKKTEAQKAIPVKKLETKVVPKPVVVSSASKTDDKVKGKSGTVTTTVITNTAKDEGDSEPTNNADEGVKMATATATTWTLAQDATIRAMKELGCSWVQIADTVKSTKKDVTQRFKELETAAKARDVTDKLGMTKNGFTGVGDGGCCVHTAIQDSQEQRQKTEGDKGNSKEKEPNQVNAQDQTKVSAKGKGKEKEPEKKKVALLSTAPRSMPGGFEASWAEQSSAAAPGTTSTTKNKGDPFADLFTNGSGDDGGKGSDAPVTSNGEKDKGRGTHCCSCAATGVPAATAEFIGHLHASQQRHYSLRPDDILWSEEDCYILETLLHRYEDNKWLHIQAGFYNWTGRMISGEVIRAKVQGDRGF